ncbi:conjugal transfer protein TraF [Spongiibacter sp. KMU-158]|uniref:Conjugal transfer protein TraF n=1 Tax=Spongiibacter pelagi TaxID=2760804 RepID=A0A927GUW4_9GAMM|nr:conjugal transfer protein TraF [Spongiibacter pelagi]MBD2858031.1 conjugal transfer protein TraF [Spongiibacter pelagi]
MITSTQRHWFSSSLAMAALALPAAALAEKVELAQLFENPADMALDAKAENDLLYAGGGLFFDDSQSLLDKALELTQEVERLEARSRGLILIPGDEQDLVDAMKDADRARTHFRSNIHLGFQSAESPQQSWLLSSRFDLSGRFYYDEDDENRLRFASITGLFMPLELGSHVQVSAVHALNIGYNYRFQFEALPNTQLAATPKFQVINLIERYINQAEYQEKDVFRFSRDLDEHYQLNLDLGLRHQLGPLGMHLVVTDIYNQKMEGVLGTTYQQRSQFKAGFDYRPSWGEIKLMSDLTPAPGFGELAARRDTRLSTRLNLSSKFSLTAGANSVSGHDEKDSFSLGLGYRLRDLRLLVEGHTAGARELGFQLGMQLPL